MVSARQLRFRRAAYGTYLEDGKDVARREFGVHQNGLHNVEDVIRQAIKVTDRELAHNTRAEPDIDQVTGKASEATRQIGVRAAYPPFGDTERHPLGCEAVQPVNTSRAHVRRGV